MTQFFNESILSYTLLVLSVIGAFFGFVKPVFNKVWEWFLFEYIEWKGRQFKKKLDMYSKDIIQKINQLDIDNKERYQFINERLDDLKEEVKEQNRVLMKFFLKNKD